MKNRSRAATGVLAVLCLWTGLDARALTASQPPVPGAAQKVVKVSSLEDAMNDFVGRLTTVATDVLVDLAQPPSRFWRPYKNRSSFSCPRQR